MITWSNFVPGGTRLKFCPNTNCFLYQVVDFSLNVQKNINDKNLYNFPECQDSLSREKLEKEKVVKKSM